MDFNKKRITSSTQFSLLLRETENNPILARGVPLFGANRISTDNEWARITGILNANGPPIRTTSEWKKVWTDLKCRSRKKLTENATELSRTEGGPICATEPTPQEHQTVQIMNLECTSLPSGLHFGVPYGNSELKEVALDNSPGIEFLDCSPTASFSASAAASSSGPAAASSSGPAAASYSGTAAASYSGTAAASYSGPAAASYSGTAAASYSGTAAVSSSGTAATSSSEIATASSNGIAAVSSSGFVPHQASTWLSSTPEGEPTTKRRRKTSLALLRKQVDNQEKQTTAIVDMLKVQNSILERIAKALEETVKDRKEKKAVDPLLI